MKQMSNSQIGPGVAFAGCPPRPGTLKNALRKVPQSALQPQHSQRQFNGPFARCMAAGPAFPLPVVGRDTPPVSGPLTGPSALRRGSGQALRRGSGQALRRGSGQALRRGSGQALPPAPHLFSFLDSDMAPQPRAWGLLARLSLLPTFQALTDLRGLGDLGGLHPEHILRGGTP
jgi:hypothetical protein